jgi:F-type H+-transporting ATPase subunit a
MNDQHDTSAGASPEAGHGQALRAAGSQEHAPGNGGASTERNLFAELLQHTRDAHEVEYPGGHVALPYILVDSEGLHVYASGERLEEAGLYTLTEKELPVRADTHAAPMLDLSLTKHIVFMWIAAIILILVAVRAARRNARRIVATGVGNIMEVFLVFTRDDIVIPNMGMEGVRYLPYLLTTFLFILVMNLLGLIPFFSTPTSNVNVTGGLAIVAFVMIQYAAIRAHGMRHYLAHLTGGVHWILWPIMVPIEILGLFTKPFALCIRLFANMTGGHIVMVSLIGLIFIFQSYLVAIAPTGFVVGIFFLELFVAFLQAYIFTILTALFMGVGMQAESHESHGTAH